MLKIDNSLLVEIGLGNLPAAEKNSFLKHIYETLEMRVGIRLADQMTNEQLDEFERYFEAKDDAGAFKWLETNFPNYKEIVQQEFDKLKAEVAQSAPQILAASQQQGGIQGQQSAHAQPAGGGAPAHQQPQPAPGQQPVGGADPSVQQPYTPAPQQQPTSHHPQQHHNASHGQHSQQQSPQHHVQHQQSQQQQQSEPPYPSQQPPAGPGAQQ